MTHLVERTTPDEVAELVQQRLLSNMTHTLEVRRSVTLLSTLHKLICYCGEHMVEVLHSIGLPAVLEECQFDLDPDVADVSLQLLQEWY